MLAGRAPTPEDIDQGALDDGTDGDAQVLLAAVLLTAAGEMRVVSTQQYMQPTQGQAGVVVVLAHYSTLN